MWVWDKEIQKFVNDDGKPLTNRAMLSFVDASIEKSKDKLLELSRLLSAGRINYTEYSTRYRQELKEEYIRQYLLGIGGRSRMTARNWGTIGGALREQYRHIIDPAELSEKQLEQRLRMAANSAREVFNKAITRTAMEWGADQERWDLRPGLNHCDDCVEFALEDWQPIGHFPQPGQGKTRCLTACGCEKSFRNRSTEEEF